MNWLKRVRIKLKEQVNIVASNPENFEEKWRFSSSRIQLYSFILVVFIVFGIVFNLLISISPFSSSKDNSSIERNVLENQFKKIKKLSQRVENQENYIKNVKEIISGNILIDSTSIQFLDSFKIIQPTVKSQATEAEKQLSKNVKNDIRTTNSNSDLSKNNITYFSSPIQGKIQEKFNLLLHPAVDIISRKDMIIKACLAGTVIYSGFSQKEGFILIIEHSEGYLSIYKNAKISLKKTGSKVQTGDPIGIVGSGGEKLNKPHLHFELWYNQSAVNPLDYMSFD